MTKWTKEKLDEARARELALDRYGDYLSWTTFGSAAGAVRKTDEANGIPTKALLAVLNGEAVIVPRKITSAIQSAAAETVYKIFNRGGPVEIRVILDQEMYSRLIAASPWAPGRGRNNISRPCRR